MGTQSPMHCKFCDVPKFGFYGNASIEDMDRRTIIEGESVRTNVHFARMGEPTWNDSSQRCVCRVNS